MKIKINVLEAIRAVDAFCRYTTQHATVQSIQYIKLFKMSNEFQLIHLYLSLNVINLDVGDHFDNNEMEIR
jgi:hypothetical protein